MYRRELISLLNRAVAALENPNDLSKNDIVLLIKDLTSAANEQLTAYCDHKSMYLNDRGLFVCRDCGDELGR
jgi:hypothetical protein